MWIVLGLILLLLLALLIPFACQALRGTGDGGSGSGDSGAQGGAQTEEAQGGQQDAEEGSAQDGGAGGAQDAGQSGDEAAGAQGEQSPGAGAAPDGVDAALVDVSNQSGDGTAVKVPEATIEGTRGWLVIHAADGGRPGAVLGHTALKEGENTDVRVELDRPVNRSQKLYAMIHAEDPADGEYTFPDGDPPVVRDGEMAVEPLAYTVSGATSGEQAGSRDGNLPETGGVPLSPLLAVGVALLLTSVAALSLAIRRGEDGG